MATLRYGALLVAALGCVTCARAGYEDRSAASSDPCAGIDCSGHGTCEATGGAARCRCASGYTPVDGSCVPLQPPSPCTSVDCSGNGTCGLSASNTAVCQCNPGYRNSGPTACQPILVGSPCATDAECDDSDVCTTDTCKSGSCSYVANSAPCDDDDPFTTPDICSNGTCNGVRRIYRSIGPQRSGALASGTTNDLVIFGARALFKQPLPDNVGVGDVIQYDTDDDGGVGALAFIVRRLSSTLFVVTDAKGAHPTPTVAVDRDWAVLRAYTSLASAEQGSGKESLGIDASLRPFETWNGGKDLVASNEQVRLACYADGADTSGVVVDGWVTGPRNYIKIFTPTLPSEVGVTQRHRGRWGSTGYRLEPASTVTGIDVWEHHVWIDGLQIASKGHGIYLADPPINEDTPNLIRVSANIVSYVGGLGPQYSGIYDYTCGTQGLRVWNNIVHGFPRACIGGYAYTTAYYYNNTVVGCEFGLLVEEAAFVAIGNVASGCKDGFSGAFAASSNFNVSDIAGDAPNATFAKGTGTVQFVDAAAKDFHLSASDTAAADQSQDLSKDPILPFIGDIDGDLRPRGPKWDIGADER